MMKHDLMRAGKCCHTSSLLQSVFGLLPACSVEFHSADLHWKIQRGWRTFQTVPSKRWPPDWTNSKFFSKFIKSGLLERLDYLPAPDRFYRHLRKSLDTRKKGPGLDAQAIFSLFNVSPACEPKSNELPISGLTGKTTFQVVSILGVCPNPLFF